MYGYFVGRFPLKDGVGETDVRRVIDPSRNWFLDVRCVMILGNPVPVVEFHFGGQFSDVGIDLLIGKAWSWMKQLAEPGGVMRCWLFYNGTVECWLYGRSCDCVRERLAMIEGQIADLEEEHGYLPSAPPSEDEQEFIRLPFVPFSHWS